MPALTHLILLRRQRAQAMLERILIEADATAALNAKTQVRSMYLRWFPIDGETGERVSVGFSGGNLQNPFSCGVPKVS
jgi:hypothetical protein